jgi:NAD(P)-dependent dehydrogenase (short-subunit alcohol dehydrogenase family)
VIFRFVHFSGHTFSATLLTVLYHQFTKDNLMTLLAYSYSKMRKCIMSRNLSEKIALITGATSGIGLASAQALAEQGAKVYITGRRQEELDAAVALLGPAATGIRADASVLSDLDNVFSTIASESGRLDILFANAGGGDMMALGAITEEHFDRIFGTNVRGLLFTVQKALPLLSDGASIILTGSTAGVKGTQSFSVYSASKAAVRNFARSWALDLKDRGIRVNVISPGPVRTAGLGGLVPEEHRQGLFDSLAAGIPRGRIGEPEEIANAVAFLASDDASFINAAELYADGGLAQI